MSEEKYVLTRQELLDLIIAREELNALDSGGVDNWAWYGEDDMFDRRNALRGWNDDECQSAELQEEVLSKYTKLD